jgi:hypothetical protein
MQHYGENMPACVALHDAQWPEKSREEPTEYCRDMERDWRRDAATADHIQPEMQDRKHGKPKERERGEKGRDETERKDEHE